MAEGTTAWSIAPTPVAGFGTAGLLYTNPVSETSPAFYTVEWEDTSYTTALLRAMTSTGEHLWTSEIEGQPAVADFTGGFLFGLANLGGIGRFTPDTDASPWRYESRGSVDRITQAADGTVYAIERINTGLLDSFGSEIIDTFLLLVDGSAGTVVKRIPIPRTVFSYTPQLSSCGSSRREYESPILGPFTHADGSASILVRRFSKAELGYCTPHPNVNAREIDRVVQLWKISPAGAITITDVLNQHCSLGIESSNCDLVPAIDQLALDTSGGAYAIWAYTPLIGSAETRLTHLNSMGIAITDAAVAPTTSVQIVGDEGTVYAAGSAMDEASWTSKWPYVGLPLMALHDGGVITHDGAALRWYAGNGDLFKTVPLANDSTSSFAKQGEWLSVDQDFSFLGKPIRAVAGPIPVQTRFSFGQIISSSSLNVAQSCVDPPLLADNPNSNQRNKGLAPNHDYKHKFDREAGTLWPANDQDERIINVLLAFEIWETANQQSGPPAPTNITFTPEDDPNAILLKQKDDLGFAGGRPILGTARGSRDNNTGFITPTAIIWDDAVSETSLYKKVGLHELGHLMGLDDIYMSIDFLPGGSVMNQASEFEDFRNYISQVVTVCDRDAARNGVLRPWVP